MLKVYFYGFIPSDVVRAVNVPILLAFMSQLPRFFPTQLINLFNVADLPVFTVNRLQLQNLKQFKHDLDNQQPVTVILALGVKSIYCI